MRSGSSGAIVRLALSLAFALAHAASTSGIALAEPSLQARVESDRQFRNGKRLYEAGQYKEACEALAMSDELEPAIGTLGLLAACREKEGDLVASWKAYLETARRAEAKRDRRSEFATQQAEALKLRLVRLAIRTAGREPGLEVKCDGQVVLESQLGAEATLNPGEHTVVARAPGLPEWRTSVTLKEGESRVVEIPAFDPAARPGGSGSGPPRWLAWAVGGFGALGIGAGAVSGVLAITNNSASLNKRTCPPAANTCSERETALTASTVSTIAFSVGGAGVAAGVVLFVLSSPSPSSGGAPASDASKKAAAGSAPVGIASLGIAPAVGPTGAGAVLLGVF